MVTDVHFNSLATGRWVNDFEIIIIKLILQIDILSISCEIALRRMPQNPSFQMCSFSDRYNELFQLTHHPLVPHICINETGQHWFRYWLVAITVPSHYLNQCWIIVNWTLRNKLQGNFNQNTKFFIHENA